MLKALNFISFFILLQIIFYVFIIIALRTLRGTPMVDADISEMKHEQSVNRAEAKVSSFKQSVSSLIFENNEL